MKREIIFLGIVLLMAMGGEAREEKVSFFLEKRGREERKR